MLKISFPLFFVFFSFILVSCQSEIGLHMSANKILNPDSRRKISEPVSVQVYQLKKTEKFKNADFYQLIDNPEKTLGDEYVAPMTSFMISPNQEQDVSVKLNSETKYFGIVAAFESIDNDKWKLVVPIENNHTRGIKIHLKNRSLIIN